MGPCHARAVARATTGLARPSNHEGESDDRHQDPHRLRGVTPAALALVGTTGLTVAHAYPPAGFECPDGDNVMTGTPSDDVLEGTSANDVIDGRGGNDSLLGGAGTDRLFGGTERDVLYAETGDDYLGGGLGDDWGHGGPGRDDPTDHEGTDTYLRVEST